jgi:hypothetical protein
LNAIQRLKPTKSVGIDDIAGFVIKGFSMISALSDLSLMLQRLPTLWQQAAVDPMLCYQVPL